jgi:two-component system, OmpR family, KDP operon response regulator KdpE
MKIPRVLVADDDPAIRKFIRANLDARNYEVLLAKNGQEALSTFTREPLDLAVLDIVMPVPDGLQVCSQIREHSNLPVIMLSVKDEESSKIKSFEIGADDYITKPFCLDELLCRIKAVLRRTRYDRGDSRISQFAIGELEIDIDRQIVLLGKKEVLLTATEYKILAFLAVNAGKVVAPQNILEIVWGRNSHDKLSLLWVNISRLRSKLNSNSNQHDYIQTKPGLGYIMR